ncbi:ABC transporter substrate-binding protein [Desulfurococcaceae archaeon MEX13E-LK6-19]|nr:ABC transporter substrate-binding protein [Desulfurococcaceae archaeon MEX13E-LK6-19]
MSGKIIPLVILAVLLVGLIAPIATVVAQEEVKGPKTDTLIYRRVKVEDVPNALGSQIDVYIFGVKPSMAEDLKKNPNVVLYTAPSAITDYILNPAPVYVHNYTGVVVVTNGAVDEDATFAKIAELEGLDVSFVKKAVTYYEINAEGNWTYVEFGAHPKYGINPFAFKDIRFAVNFLVDRDFIINSIYLGYAVPQKLIVSPYDPTYRLVYDIEEKLGFTYDPAKAADMISKVLYDLGAYKGPGGYWYFADKPIVVKFIIRVEDERKELGDLLASELEKQGFSVNKMYLTFGEAIYKVYFTDPADFEWHIYTEGWGKGGLDKYDNWGPAFWGAPWLGWVPGWGEATYWNYKNDKLDEITQKIAFGLYHNESEYEQLYREATEIIAKEALRIFIACPLTIYPALRDVKGITLDLGAGLRGIWNPREWYIEGKNELRIGHLWVWTSSTIWNIYGGFDDVYSVDIERATADPMTWRDPRDGSAIPFRANFTVETAGPDGKLDVPADAVVWNATTNEWVPVGEGVQATSKVEFDLSKFIGAKWHHGITITWADVIAAWAYSWDLAYDPEWSALESSYARSNRPWFDTIKGIIFDTANNKIIIYVDYWHFDPAEIAAYVSFGITNPVELHAAMFQLCLIDKTYAFTDTRSEAEKIPQISLVLKEHAADVKAALDEVDYNTLVKPYVTVGGTTYLSESEWSERVTALKNWIDEHNHAWVSQGPYYLDKFDKDAQEVVLKAFRDPTYPFKPGDWYLGMPTMPRILDVTFSSEVLSPGDYFNITVTAEGEPPMEVIYIIKDPETGAVVARGTAENISETEYRVTLDPTTTAEFKSYYTYDLIIIARSVKYAQIDFYKTKLPTGPSKGELQFLQTLIGETLGTALQDLSSKVDTIDSKISALEPATPEDVEKVASKVDELAGTLQLVEILVIVTLVLSIIGIAAAFIKK